MLFALVQKKFYPALAYPVWTGHWLGEEEAKEGFLLRNAKGKIDFQFHLAEMVQMPWAGDKDTAAALAGSSHAELNSGQVNSLDL